MTAVQVEVEQFDGLPGEQEYEVDLTDQGERVRGERREQVVQGGGEDTPR